MHVKTVLKTVSKLWVGCNFDVRCWLKSVTDNERNCSQPQRDAKMCLLCKRYGKHHRHARISPAAT